MRKKNDTAAVYNRRLRHQAALAGLLVFIAMVLLVFVARAGEPDQAVFNWIATWRSGTGTRFMRFITFYGNHAFLIPANLLLATAFLLRKKFFLGITILAIALSSLGLMSLTKNIAQRHRPADPLISGITNYSFPSGHAFMTVAFFGLLTWLTLSFINERWKRNSLVGLFLLLILIIGLSRVYLRVHYTTDVLAGWSLGTAWLMTGLLVAERYRPVTSTAQSEAG